ncbi:ABC transporter ATP-binding protein [Brevibacillus ruminantium]|uniref:ABC transporter ATP-binding protein n=1 Tax=Brevibacillus ruminantium TaxID=2950604 RepID=A0ABY4WH20_9BACL|nr:ABC transporter ATP-binding protein [Brevibacillus ruminantium]USG66382.1 ABC transporter ATP-binding protein [Brevibacillus ruminantium]
MTMNIRIEKLSKTYRGDGVITTALEDVTLLLQNNECTSIVGPSGSGKSTLLQVIGTLDAPTAGMIAYDDVDVGKLKGKTLADFRFARIGFIFQHFHLLPTLTALENVMSPLFPRKVSYDKKERAQELLDWVGLAHKQDSLPSQLSGGEQQRVAIARALVNRPQWLLADEPTGNLDTNNGEMVFQLLRKYQQEYGTGIIFVTHDEHLAGQTDRRIEMRDGRVIADIHLTKL